MVVDTNPDEVISVLTSVLTVLNPEIQNNSKGFGGLNVCLGMRHINSQCVRYNTGDLSHLKVCLSIPKPLWFCNQSF